MSWINRYRHIGYRYIRQRSVRVIPTCVPKRKVLRESLFFENKK
nr:MAG TPA: hypothetical protein [Caudoviricetes sp.]